MNDHRIEAKNRKLEINFLNTMCCESNSLYFENYFITCVVSLDLANISLLHVHVKAELCIFTVSPVLGCLPSSHREDLFFNKKLTCKLVMLPFSINLF